MVTTLVSNFIILSPFSRRYDILKYYLKTVKTENIAHFDKTFWV